MKKHNIKIKIDNKFGKIFIDDRELECVVEYSIYQHAGRTPKVNITFDPDELEIDLKQADVTFDLNKINMNLDDIEKVFKQKVNKQIERIEKSE